MKNNAFTIHCKVGKGTFFGRKQEAEKYGEKNIRHLVKNTRHYFEISALYFKIYGLYFLPL